MVCGPRRTRMVSRGVLLSVALVVLGSQVLAFTPDPLPDPVAVEGLPGTPRVVDAEEDISPSGAACRGYTFPVRKGPLQGDLHDVYAELCSRSPLRAGTPVQILLHGGTYNHSVFDFPFEPETYSYVEQATQRGYATLNVDRLGYGQSDTVDPYSLDFETAGYVTSQLVTYLKAGALGGIEFDQVVLNGFSMGGLTAQHAASGNPTVDAVIVTGVGHRFSAEGIMHLIDKTYPAEFDDKFSPAPGVVGNTLGDLVDSNPFTLPRATGDWDEVVLQLLALAYEDSNETSPVLDELFADELSQPTFELERGLLAGYLTTIPGVRPDAFIAPAPYDEGVEAPEEELKDTMSIRELLDITLDSYNPDITMGIQAPVLYSLGELDALWCPRTGNCYEEEQVAQEPGLYRPGTPVTTYIVPDAGHSIFVSETAPLFYEATFEFLADAGIG